MAAPTAWRRKKARLAGAGGGVDVGGGGDAGGDAVANDEDGDGEGPNGDGEFDVAEGAAEPHRRADVEAVRDGDGGEAAAAARKGELAALATASWWRCRTA